jgi:WD40 repeat protein
MDIRILLFAIILAPAVSASECPKNIYYLTPEYVFADGNMVFKYIDMDLSEGGFRDILRARPGELVTVEVSWVWGPNCPDCTVYVNSFGSWAPDSDIMRLYSGPKGKPPSISVIPISFLAPDAPGLYKFRVIFAYDKEYAADFDGSNLCSVAECQTRGECNILIAEGDVNVTMLSAEGTIPLSVRMTSPETTAVSGILKANVGTVIPVHADIGIPPNTTVDIVVEIDDREVSDLLPYSWNTFNSTTGTHWITVTARDEKGTFAYDEVKVLLLDRAKAYGVIPPLVWKQRIKGIVKDLDVSERGAYIVAGSDEGFVYLFDRSGKKIWEYASPGPINSVALNPSGGKLLFASGNVLYYSGRDGSLLWNYSGPTEIESVAMNRDGDRIAFAAGNVLHYLIGNGSLLWKYSTSNPITSTAVNADGDRVASASGNVLYYFNGDGSLIWTYSSSTQIESVAMNRDGSRIAFISGNTLYYLDNLASLLWNLANVTETNIVDVALSADGSFILAKSNNALFAINKRGSITWQEISEDALGTISISPDGKFLTYSEGEFVFLRDNSRITIPERSGIWVYAAIGILIVLAGGMLVKRRIPFVLPIIGIKRAETKKGRKEAPSAITSVEVAALKMKVINHKTKRPIKAAKILSGNRVVYTGENGEAMLKDLQFGEHTVTVEKEVYQPGQETRIVGEGENFMEIELIPKTRTTGKNEETLKGIMYNLSRAYESVSMHDICLPNYYKSIGERIVEFLETLSYSPELIKAEEQEEFIDSFVEAGSAACKGLQEVMSDWRNIKLYQAASELEKVECSAREVKVEALHAVLTNPESFRHEVERRLSELDTRMMEHMNKLTIIPVSTLWQVSKELLRESLATSGSRKSAMVFFANALTSYTDDMLENEEIIKRLKFAIL